MRPQRDALTRHATPMNASDVVHKIIFKAGGALKPIAKTTHGIHQRRNALGPLHSRSRSGLRDLDTSGSIFEFGLTRIRLQLAIYFCLHRRQVSRTRQDGKPVKRAGLRIVRHRAPHDSWQSIDAMCAILGAILLLPFRARRTQNPPREVLGNNC